MHFQGWFFVYLFPNVTQSFHSFYWLYSALWILTCFYIILYHFKSHIFSRPCPSQDCGLYYSELLCPGLQIRKVTCCYLTVFSSSSNSFSMNAWRTHTAVTGRLTLCPSPTERRGRAHPFLSPQLQGQRRGRLEPCFVRRGRGEGTGALKVRNVESWSSWKGSSTMYSDMQLGPSYLAAQPYPSSLGTFRTRIYMVVLKASQVTQMGIQGEPTPVRSLSVGSVRGFSGGLWSPHGPH